MKKMKKNKKPQFAVVMTELAKNRREVINEKGEKFPRWHGFKIGQIVSLIPDYPVAYREFEFFDGISLQQTLEKEDFELLP